MKERVIWSDDYFGLRTGQYGPKIKIDTYSQDGDILICNKCLKEVGGWSCDGCNSIDIELVTPSQLANKKIERRNKKIEIILENND